MSSDESSDPVMGAEHMTARSYQCLRDALDSVWRREWEDGIPVSAIAALDPKDLMKRKNFGRGSLGEVRALLLERGADFASKRPLP